MSSDHSSQPTAFSRRKFIGGAGAAAAIGSAGVLVGAGPADAHGGGRRTFDRKPAPSPIEFTTPPEDPGPPDPFNEIHWALPGPDGATTQILELPSFGLDADPSTVGNFDGFTAYAVLAGQAKGGDGESYDCEFDVRVMQGRYMAADGDVYRGTFAFF